MKDDPDSRLMLTRLLKEPIKFTYTKFLYFIFIFIHVLLSLVLVGSRCVSISRLRRA